MSLQVYQLAKSFSVRTLFQGVTFAVNPGSRVALVGSNGSGKTTLMRIILGQETADAGSVILPKDARVGYLPQEIFLAEDESWQRERSTLTLWNLAIQAFSRLDDIRRDLADVEEAMAAGNLAPALQDRHDRLTAAFESAGGYTWQARTVRLLKGLGFPEERFHDPLRTFSGGWQMRAYFCRLLLREPDYLLLDEPTNYLDISSIRFLEDYLGDYPGGILMVSHDRYFLDGLATSVVALVPEGVRVFTGNYSEFLQARETWAVEAAAAQDRQNRERRRVERFIERFRYKASKASQVQSRIKSLEKLETIQQVRSTPKLDFRFPDCPPSGDVVLRAEDLHRHYGDKRVLSDLTFSLYRGDRLAIIGENGTGKTTLMRILAGEDASFTGTLDWGYRVHQGYFAQDEEISFEGGETVWSRLLREAPLDEVPRLRGLLGVFLFSGDMVESQVRVLSGGEKSRLGLARLMLHPCNLLLLDEPTNHLDLNSREALLNALEEFPGTLLIVSHDRYCLDALATRVLALEAGSFHLYDGNYSQYLWARRQREAGHPEAGAGMDAAVSLPGADDRQARRDAWKDRKRRENQQKRLDRERQDLEDEIGRMEQEIQQLEHVLAFPEPGMSGNELTEVSLRHQTLTTTLTEHFSRWEKVCETLEQHRQEREEGMA